MRFLGPFGPGPLWRASHEDVEAERCRGACANSALVQVLPTNVYTMYCGCSFGNILPPEFGLCFVVRIFKTSFSLKFLQLAKCHITVFIAIVFHHIFSVQGILN